MRVQKRYCSVPCFYSWYRAVPFLYQLFTVYQKPLPIRYCPVPCLYRLSGNRYRYTVLDGIGTMCKTVPFGTFPIPCTGNTVSEQYQFLPYNSTGTVSSSTVMFTGGLTGWSGYVDLEVFPTHLYITAPQGPAEVNAALEFHYFRTIPQWNQLPASLAETNSLATFKSRLSCLSP